MPVYNRKNEWYNIDGGKDTEDFVFLLSLEEADKYFGNSGDYTNKNQKRYDNDKFVANSYGSYLSNEYDRDRASKDEKGKACWWWLRSPGGISYCAAYVNSYGYVRDSGNYVDFYYGVRPALWLNL